MEKNIKNFLFIVGAVALGVAVGKLVAEPMVMYVRGMIAPSAPAPAAAPETAAA